MFAFPQMGSSFGSMLQFGSLRGGPEGLGHSLSQGGGSSDAGLSRQKQISPFGGSAGGGGASGMHSVLGGGLGQQSKDDAGGDDKNVAKDLHKSSSRGLGQAQANTHIQFQPVLRGDEKHLDSQVTNEHQFGQLADQVAREYGLDPAMFRAQLQAESGAFNGPTSYLSAQHLVGDKDRASSHNESLGLGQISRYFLDNGPWSKGGPGNPRVGGQTVTSAQYENSLTVQLRMAASNDAQRIADHGGNVRAGLASYVNGSPDTSAPKTKAYLSNIDRYMRDPNIQGA